MENGQWIPLLMFAVRKGISLSTLRRRIKSNQIKYQIKKGRYYLWDDEVLLAQDSHKIISDLQEQVADLKTLVKVLESKAPQAL